MPAPEIKIFPFLLACLLFSAGVLTTTMEIAPPQNGQTFWLSSYLSITVFLAFYGVVLSIKRTSWLLLSLSIFILLTPSYILILHESTKQFVTLPMYLLLEEVHLLVSWLMALFFVDGMGRLVCANLHNVKMLRWNLYLMSILTVVAGLHCFINYGVGWEGIGKGLPLGIISFFSLLSVATLTVLNNDYEPVALQTLLCLSGLFYWSTDFQLLAPMNANSQLLLQFAMLNLLILALRAHEQAQIQRLVVHQRQKQRRSTEYEVNHLIDAMNHLINLKQPFSLIVFETAFSGMLKQVLSPNQRNVAVHLALKYLSNFLQTFSCLFRFSIHHSDIRENRLFSKAGEDCYAIIFVGEQDRDELQHLISTMQDVITNPVTVGQHSFKLHSVFSAVQFPSTRHSAKRLLTLAKRGLGQAEQCTGRYFIYNLNNNSSRTVHWQLVVDLQHAIEQETIEIFHQPQVNLSTHKPIGSEALLRWNHDQFGFINPELVIQLAEENNLIHALTELVIKKSMAQLAILWRQGFKERLSINVSAHDLLRKTFLPNLQYVANSTGITLDYITIELTESAAMEDFELAHSLFNDLTSLGIQIAIDDFGTGYSSLSTLAHLPFHELKVDKQFVNNIATSAKNQSITQSIIDLAKHLNAHVVAEGIDSLVAEQWLSKIKCDIGQGYLYAKGLSLEEYLQWLNKQHSDNSVDFMQNHRKVVAK